MKKKDLFWGLLLVLAGVLIIVNRLGYFVEISVFEIVASIILVGIMIKSMIHVSFPGILFPAALLCILFADQWNLTELTPWPILLTALLGSIGLSLIFKQDSKWCSTHWYSNHDANCHHSSYHNEHQDDEHFDQVIDQPDGSQVNCFVSFGSTMKYINTDNFERANIKCSFGAMKVYFDNAIVSSGKAEIYLDISFSGVELYIPKTWNIVFGVDTTLAGISEKNRKVESNSPVVTLKGNISLSGVEIIYI